MKTAKLDWNRADALTDEQVQAAVECGSQGATRQDHPSSTRLTLEEFAEWYKIPLDTMRDWEQGAAQPDQAARADLRAIALRKLAATPRATQHLYDEIAEIDKDHRCRQETHFGGPCG